jgi:creatinine amidohydrolase
MIWQNLTSPQLNQVDRRTPVVLPIAAIEQHGPHLPLATDRIINELFCAELDRQIGPRVLFLPTMAVGCSEHHMEFTGSLTLTHETFARQAEEMLASAARHGFTNLVILNSHGGNLGVGRVIAERAGAALPKCRMVLVTWWQAAAQELLTLSETGPGGVGHACEFETSLVMLAAPELVDERAIPAKQNVATYGWAEGDLLRGAGASLYRTMKQMTPSGAYGEPRAASREKGAAIRDVVVNALKRIILDLADSN